MSPHNGYVGANMGSQFKTLSAEECETLGRTCYGQKDYWKALDAFTAALQKSNKPPIRILDCRAAVNEKLDRLPAALLDARRMIKLEKYGAKGYLRTGKVLQLQGNDTAALRIYELGISVLPSHAPDKELISDSLKKLERKTKTTGTDPLLLIPVEVAFMILSQIDLKDRVRCLRVCKKWRLLLESLTGLWNVLDIPVTRKKTVNITSIKAMLRYSKNNIKSVTFRSLRSAEGDVLKFLLKHSRTMEDIVVSRGYLDETLSSDAPWASSLKTLVLTEHCETSWRVVHYVLQECPTLVTAVFANISGIHSRSAFKLNHDCPHLRVLHLYGKATYDSGLLLHRIPNVTELHLVNCHLWSDGQATATFESLKHLQRLKLSAQQRIFYPRLPPTIVDLDLSNCIRLRCEISEAEFIATQPLTHLERLNVRSCRELKTEAIMTMLKSSKAQITNLDIGDIIFDAADILHDLVEEGFTKTLRSLGLANGFGLEDDHITFLAENAPCLEELDISGSRVTGVAVKALVNKPGCKLKKLNVQRCTGIGLDAIDYLRRSDVDFQFYTGA